MIAVTGTVAFDTVATVPRLPKPNETSRIERLTLVPGGAAGNVALALARLGERPRLAAAVGPDFQGSAYEARLAAAGVDLAGVERLDVPTAHAVVVSDPAASHVYFYPGASHGLSPAAAGPAADIGHFTAGPIDRYAARMAACRVVTFDPGQECFHRDPAHVRRVLEHVDVLFLNEHERDRLAGAFGWTSAKEFLDAGPDVVVVTEGARGQTVHERARETVVPAVPARVVEPTGAGDGHRAGYLFALARGADAVTCARVGGVVASFAIESLGTQEGLPALPDVVERFEKAFGAWPFRRAAAAP